MPQLASVTIDVNGATSTLKPISRESGVSAWSKSSGAYGSSLPGKSAQLILKKNVKNGVVTAVLKLRTFDPSVASLADVPAEGLRFGEIEISSRFHQEFPATAAADQLTALRGLLFDPAIVEVITTEADMY